MKIGIIGVGNIGSEIYRRAKALDWDVRFILEKDGTYKNLTEKIEDPEECQRRFSDLEIVFLAIPTSDDGKTEFNYLESFLKKNIPVVTCGKGALSNYFSELKKYKSKIGYSATVGGGTRMLRYLEERINPKVEEIHAVVNGTLNYIFEEVSRGRSLGEVVEETKKLGYAEPGSENILDVINKESVGDIPMKAAILFNVSGLSSSYMKAKDSKIHKLDYPGLKRLIKQCKDRRYIVSITKEDNKEEVISGFEHKIGEWIISGGFKNIRENNLYSRLVPSGVDNSLLICDGKYGIDGTYVLSGPGAGASPTVSSMIKDALNLVKK